MRRRQSAYAVFGLTNQQRRRQIRKGRDKQLEQNEHVKKEEKDKKKKKRKIQR